MSSIYFELLRALQVEYGNAPLNFLYCKEGAAGKDVILHKTELGDTHLEYELTMAFVYSVATFNILLNIQNTVEEMFWRAISAKPEFLSSHFSTQK